MLSSTRTAPVPSGVVVSNWEVPGNSRSGYCRVNVKAATAWSFRSSRTNAALNWAMPPRKGGKAERKAKRMVREAKMRNTGRTGAGNDEHSMRAERSAAFLR